MSVMSRKAPLLPCLRRQALFVTGLLLCSLFTVSISAAAADRLFLTDGQVLVGAVANEHFRFATPYGEVSVPVEAISKYQHTPDKEKIFTVNDELISGYLTDAFLRLAVRNGPTLQVRKEVLDRVVLRGRTKPAARKQSIFQMANGDLFYGDVIDDTLTIATSYGTLNFSWSSIMTISDDKGQTRIVLADGAEVQGHLSTHFINVTTLYGFDLRLPRSSIRKITIRD